jgi:hypothetical protein
VRFFIDRAGNQLIESRTLQQLRRQSAGNDLVSAGERDLAASNFPDLRRQAVIDLVPDHQEAHQCSIRPRTAVDGLNEALVEMMVSEPPVAGFAAIFVERLFEIFLGSLAAEAGCLRVQGHYLSAAVDENEQVAVGNFRDVARRVLDGHRIGAGHDGPGDRKVRQQGNIAGQHPFALVPEILEGGDRVPQVDGDTLPHIFFYAASHQQEADRCQARRDDQHRQQKAGPQPHARHKKPFGID